MSALKIFTDQNFEDEVIKSDTPVFVDFWSAYCNPCKIQMPIVEELAKEYIGKVKFGKLEVGDNPDIPAKYHILSIPALANFEKGKLIQLKSGLQNKENLKKMLNKVK